MNTLLVIDDEPSVLQVFSKVFGRTDVAVLTAPSGDEGIKLARQESPDAVVLDLILPDTTGLQVFREIHDIDPRLPVILMTAGGSAETAIEATGLGAFDYLVKPLDFGEVEYLVERAFEVRRVASEPVSLPDEPVQSTGHGNVLIGGSPPMQQVYKAIGRVASQPVMVLITGESGTGKELVARAIYQHSRRQEKPFLVVNCAAIPETLLESELFGHEKGAFTGADRRRIGKFEQCGGGTLFLDEIGDMPLALQGKILRVLQDQRFERVGGNDTITTDVRIIAATNRNLEQMVEEGCFRADLFYRLNVYSILLPPLRSRQDDLPLLSKHFLGQANLELGKSIRTIAPDALELLAQYSWPGNIRELQSVLKRAVLQATGPVLTVDCFPDTIRIGVDVASAEVSPGFHNFTDWEQFVEERYRAGIDCLYDEAVGLAEQQVIARVLQRTGGNQVQAAKTLGITRTTLRTKMRQLGISLERIVRGEGDP